MPHVEELTLKQLEERRKVILAQAGTSYGELARKARDHALVGDEWAAWDEIKEIDFLLKG
jgi:hypothetical protein